MPAALHLDWDLPDGALTEPFRTELVEAVKREVAVRLFADGRITSGYGAAMLGISRLEFIDLLKERRVPLFTYQEGELQQELEAFDRSGGSPHAPTS